MGLTKPRAAQIFNLDYKQSTRVVTVSNITLSGGAPTVVDGVTLVKGDRVLVIGQTTGSQNGLYVVTTLGTGSNGTWARTSDSNETGEIEAGMIVMVTEGTTYADTQWKLITNDPITVGTTSLTFVQNYSANSISSGTSNIVVLTNSAVTISSAGSANVLLIDSNTITATANLNPAANVTYSLGNTSNRWKDLWLSNSTIYLGNVTLGATAQGLTVDGNSVLTAGAGGNVVSVSGNITGGNILTVGLVSATGNVTGNYILGNGALLSGIGAGYSNANVVALLGTFGSNVISTTGNIDSGNLRTSGQVSATGNITGGNLLINNNAIITGNLTVNGTETIFNVQTLSVNDKDIIVANNVSGAANVNGAGIQAGNPAVATWLFNNATTSWQSNIGITPSANGTLSLGGSSNYWNTAFLNTASVTGNVQAGNLMTTGLISATGAVTGASVVGGVMTGTSLSVSGGVTAASVAGGVITGTSTSVTGTQTAASTVGGVITGSSASVSGTVTAASTVGGVITGTSASVSGTVTAASTVGGVITGTSASVSGAVTGGSLSVSTGNVTGGNLILSGAIEDSAQLDIRTTASNANIVLTPNGTGNVNTGANVSVTGRVTAASVVGGVITGTSTSVTGTQTAASTVGGVITGSSASVSGAVTAASTVGGVITGTSASVSGTVTGASLAGTITTAAQTNITSVGTLGSLSVTANVQAGNVRTAGLVSASGSITGASVVGGVMTGTSLSVSGTVTAASTVGGVITGSSASVSGTVTGASLAGTITTAAQTNITSVGTLGSLSVTANVQAGNVRTVGQVSATGNISGNFFIGNGSQLTGISAGGGGNSITNGTSNVVVASSGNISVGVAGTAVLSFATSGIVNNQANGVGNIGSATGYFNTVFAKATSAQYADLAEMYVADQNYEPGTVVEFGGSAEVTVSSQDHSTQVAGIVSTNPSYLMNAGQTGKHVVAVALIGRVPCKVTGTIVKGDRLVASHIAGVAGVLNTAKYQPACIIGKALENYNSDQVGTIEVAVGRT